MPSAHSQVKSTSKNARCLRELNPRRNIGFFRDPIYNYIRFTQCTDLNEYTEYDLISDPWIQRLKRLYQTQGTFRSYHGAEHSRYQHSIGVMHLAGEFARVVYSNFLRYMTKTRGSNYVRDRLPRLEYVIETFRIAGLLHDVGHGPMSHCFDDIYLKKYDLNHEKLGIIIIKDQLSNKIRKIKRTIYGDCESIKPQDIVDILDPDQDARLLDFWKGHLRLIIHGLYSADSMDYLVRDSHYCGTPEYGKSDVWRLIYSTILTDDGMAIVKGSLGALKAFLLARLQMYENVYFHRHAKAYELNMSEHINDIMSYIHLGNPGNNLGKYILIDDQLVSSFVGLTKLLH